MLIPIHLSPVLAAHVSTRIVRFPCTTNDDFRRLISKHQHRSAMKLMMSVRLALSVGSVAAISRNHHHQFTPKESNSRLLDLFSPTGLYANLPCSLCSIVDSIRLPHTTSHTESGRTPGKECRRARQNVRDKARDYHLNGADNFCSSDTNRLRHWYTHTYTSPTRPFAGECCCERHRTAESEAGRAKKIP